MTIIIGNHTVDQLPDSVEEIFEEFPALKTDAQNVVRWPSKIIESPEQVLYVTQKEYAVIKSGDPKIKLVGSDDATTCHIAVIVNRQDSIVCLAHLDSADDLAGLHGLVSDCILLSTEERDSPALELSLYGGYHDEKAKSEILTLDLVQFFSQSSIKFHLKTFCVGRVNTRTYKGTNWPIVYGVAVDVLSNFAIFPAKFSLGARGPYLPLRSARFLSEESRGVVRVYHSKDGLLKIKPFSYPFYPQMVDWLYQSDDLILKYFSTSPNVEPDHFAHEMKRTFEFIVKNPYPLNSVFKTNKPLTFSLSAQGVWQEL